MLLLAVSLHVCVLNDEANHQVLAAKSNSMVFSDQCE